MSLTNVKNAASTYFELSYLNRTLHVYFLWRWYYLMWLRMPFDQIIPNYDYQAEKLLIIWFESHYSLFGFDMILNFECKEAIYSIYYHVVSCRFFSTIIWIGMTFWERATRVINVTFRLLEIKVFVTLTCAVIANCSYNENFHRFRVY